MLIEEQLQVWSMLAGNLERPFDIDRWSKGMRLIKPNLRPWVLPFPNTRLRSEPLTLASDRLIDDIDPSDMFLALVSVTEPSNVLFEVLQQLLWSPVIFLRPCRTLGTYWCVQPHCVPMLFGILNHGISFFPSPYPWPWVHCRLLKRIPRRQHLKVIFKNLFC